MKWLKTPSSCEIFNKVCTLHSAMNELSVRVQEKTTETVDWPPRTLRFQQRKKKLFLKVHVSGNCCNRLKPEYILELKAQNISYIQLHWSYSDSPVVFLKVHFTLFIFSAVQCKTTQNIVWSFFPIWLWSHCLVHLLFGTVVLCQGAMFKWHNYGEWAI